MIDSLSGFSDFVGILLSNLFGDNTCRDFEFIGTITLSTTFRILSIRDSGILLTSRLYFYENIPNININVKTERS